MPTSVLLNGEHRAPTDAVGLGFVRQDDASQADDSSLSRREGDVRAVNIGQFTQHFPRAAPQSCLATSRFERFLQRKGLEIIQDMGLNAIPSCDHTGTPAIPFDGLFYFTSSTTSGLDPIKRPANHSVLHRSAFRESLLVNLSFEPPHSFDGERTAPHLDRVIEAGAESSGHAVVTSRNTSPGKYLRHSGSYRFLPAMKLASARTVSTDVVNILTTL
jgi:hypothetical protein